jgi:hypothetical protein
MEELPLPRLRQQASFPANRQGVIPLPASSPERRPECPARGRQKKISHFAIDPGHGMGSFRVSARE